MNTTKSFIDIDKNGNLDSKSMEEFEFDLLVKSAMHPGAFILHLEVDKEELLEQQFLINVQKAHKGSEQARVLIELKTKNESTKREVSQD